MDLLASGDCDDLDDGDLEAALTGLFYFFYYLAAGYFFTDCFLAAAFLAVGCFFAFGGDLPLFGGCSKSMLDTETISFCWFMSIGIISSFTSSSSPISSTIACYCYFFGDFDYLDLGVLVF